MSRKIKFHTFHFLFRLFAYLADKSGGWRVFVSPKLVLGSLIVGLGLTTSGMAEGQNQNTNQQLNKESPENKNDSIKSQVVEENTLCYVSEQMPQYPGGEEVLLNFIAKNLKYPETAIRDKIQGKVRVRFLVTETGKIDSIKVLKSLDSACDKEAIRVLKTLPSFIPGKQNGVNVNVWYTLPVTFKLPQ